MIADAEGSVAVAGVMGGLNSEVEADTTDVLLEAAWFLPTNIRPNTQWSTATSNLLLNKRGLPTIGAAERVTNARRSGCPLLRKCTKL